MEVSKADATISYIRSAFSGGRGMCRETRCVSEMDALVRVRFTFELEKSENRYVENGENTFYAW